MKYLVTLTLLVQDIQSRAKPGTKELDEESFRRVLQLTLQTLDMPPERRARLLDRLPEHERVRVMQIYQRWQGSPGGGSVKIECVPLHEAYYVTGWSPTILRLLVECGQLIAVKGTDGHDYLEYSTLQRLWDAVKEHPATPHRDTRPPPPRVCHELHRL
jgi:hypothetical protein